MKAPTIVVAGMGRCGSSMVMQMLAASGVECGCEAPLYERDDVAEGMNMSARWFAQIGAVKVLAPQLFRIDPQAHIRVIWLARNLEEQAKSYIKCVRALGMAKHPGVSEDVVLQHYKDKIEEYCVAGLKAVHSFPLLPLSFEGILSDPVRAAVKIEAFCPEVELSVHQMASAVMERSPACKVGVEFEVIGEA